MPNAAPADKNARLFIFDFRFLIDNINFLFFMLEI